MLFEPPPEQEEADPETADEAPEAVEPEEEIESEEEAEGNDEEEADDDEPEPPRKGDGKKIPVKVDGEIIEATLDELKQSYSGQKAIQKRLQHAAELAKQTQAEREEFAAFVREIRERGVLMPPQPPDLSMLDRDPLGFMRDKAIYDAQLSEYNRQQQAMHRQSEAHRLQQERMKQERLFGEREQLLKKLPELNDEAKKQGFISAIAKTAESYGFAPEELGSIADHRQLVVLHDAMKYRELMAKKGQVAAKAAKAPPVLKPGTAPRPEMKSKQSMADLKSRARAGDKNAELALFFEPAKRKR
jgi:hypothetical protein